MFFHVKYDLSWLVLSWNFPLDIYSRVSKNACMNLEGRLQDSVQEVDSWDYYHDRTNVLTQQI